MSPTTVRNLAAFVLSVAAIAVVFRYGCIFFGWISFPIDGLGAVLVFFTVAGILGSFAFTGGIVKRAGLVLLVGTTYGVLGEVFSPGPRRAGAQLVVAVAFSLLAAVVSLAAGFIRSLFGEDRGQEHV